MTVRRVRRHDSDWQQLRSEEAALNAKLAEAQVGEAFTRRLLQLRDLAPGARTPGEAASMLGINLADWLASDPSP